jgi:hypothetical protein
MGQIFKLAERYLDQIDPGEFVEIGTSRGGDDGSTSTFAKWAVERNTRLITVDVDPVNCEYVQALNLPGVEIVNSTGEDYLYHRVYSLRPISFLYLDNFDWDWHPDRYIDFIAEQKIRYQALGLEMTNVNSQRAHLEQMTSAIHHMAKRSLVVCDDTWFNRFWGHYSGKSGAVVPYLLAHGYQVLYTEEQPVYGTILGRGITDNL